MGAPELLIVLLLLVIWVGLPTAAYRDMRARGHTEYGWTLVLLMLVVWPIGYLLWAYWHFRLPRID